MRAGAELVGYVSLVWQVWLEDMVRVCFDTVKEVIVGGVEQVSDGCDVVAAVSASFCTMKQRVEACAVGSRAHARPRRSCILNLRDGCGTKYVVHRYGWCTMRVQHSHGIQQSGIR